LVIVCSGGFNATNDGFAKGITMIQSVDEAINKLRSLASPEAVAGMARFGISTENTLGISMPTLRDFARQIGKDHQLAWGCGSPPPRSPHPGWSGGYPGQLTDGR
jgi:hypothetical protein